MADPKVASNFHGILADPVLSLHKCDRGTMLPIHPHSAVDQVGLRSCHSATVLADVPVFMQSTGNNSCTMDSMDYWGVLKRMVSHSHMVLGAERRGLVENTCNQSIDRPITSI